MLITNDETVRIDHILPPSIVLFKTNVQKTGQESHSLPTPVTYNTLRPRFTTTKAGPKSPLNCNNTSPIYAHAHPPAPAQATDLLLLTKQWCVPRLDYTNATPEQQLVIHIQAAAVSCRTAVISGLAAALIQGIPTLNQNHDTHVELTLPHHHRPPSRTQWPLIFYYRDAYLPPEDITNIAGHRVTTIPRTFTDIYARHGELEALVYLESALNRGHTKQEFQDYLTTHHGQWNTVKLQRILDLACYGIESVQETRARYAIITQLPTTLVTPQAVIPVPHRTIVGRWSLKRVDLLLDNWLVIEIDGHSKYIGAPQHRLNIFPPRLPHSPLHPGRNSHIPHPHHCPDPPTPTGCPTNQTHRLRPDGYHPLLVSPTITGGLGGLPLSHPMPT